MFYHIFKFARACDYNLCSLIVLNDHANARAALHRLRTRNVVAQSSSTSASASSTNTKQCQCNWQLQISQFPHEFRQRTAIHRPIATYYRTTKIHIRHHRAINRTIAGVLFVVVGGVVELAAERRNRFVHSGIAQANCPKFHPTHFRHASSVICT